MKIISIVNPKGGAGKTTSCVNIAYALKNKGKKILLIDTDPRSAIEIYLNIKNKFTINELIQEQHSNYTTFSHDNLSKYIINKDGVDIIISSQKLVYLHDFFIKDPKSELQAIIDLKPLFNEYDYVVIDTEGTINYFSHAVLNATNYIFTPTKTSIIDASGIRDLTKLITFIKKDNKNIELKKIFIVQAKRNTKIYNNTYEELNTFFNKDVFSKISIREDQNILNSMEQHKDIFSYRNNTNAAIDYRNLVDEFLNEEENKNI